MPDHTHLEIRPISFREVAAREDLLEAHYDELATDKQRMVLDPDLARYQQLEDQGVLLGLGLYDREAMVGYSVGIITTSMHYRALTFYQNDVVFLEKAYRNLGAGKQLIDATEAAAKARAAGMVLWHAKPGTPLFFLMTALGYATQDVIFGRGL